MVKKDITVGAVTVDPRQGTISLLSPLLVINMKQLNFKNDLDQFTVISVNGKNVELLDGDVLEKGLGEDMDYFLMELVNILHFEMKHRKIKNKRGFLYSILNNIKKSINKEVYDGDLTRTPKGN